MVQYYRSYCWSTKKVLVVQWYLVKPVLNTAIFVATENILGPGGQLSDGQHDLILLEWLLLQIRNMHFLVS